jgi:ribosome recycling factor
MPGAVAIDDLKAGAEARRWKKELGLAGKREKDWRRDSEKIVKRYRGEEKKKNRWNVLYSNTSILRPFVYNSRANPDVRRRFRDADPIGKAVSLTLERGLMLVLDCDETESAIKNDVLDALLPGRGVSRVRYIPSIKQNLPAGGVPPTGSATPAALLPSAANAEPSTRKLPPPDSPDDDDDGPAVSDEGVLDEELEYERCTIDHVSWKDFRHGFGRIWEEVPWTGYRHKLTRPEAEKVLGKDALDGIEFAVPTEDDDKHQGTETSETEKVAEFWEIWDKAGDRVFFLSENASRIMYPVATPDGAPPLDLPGFFPSPKPLYMVEDTDSLLPIPLFQLYEQQADELDKISRRIDKVVEGMRLRGIYDSKLDEMQQILASDDNELVPVQNAQAWREGGLDKAISWMPVDQCVAILSGLYQARTQTKAIIDEIMGIADIMRGATDPQETLGAQTLKQTNGNTRLNWMRAEVQRYIRDLLRLATCVIADKFSQQTLATMTELQFPTAAEKAQLAASIQQAQMQPPPQPGQPPPPPPPDPALLQVPTWEDILGTMRNNALRYFKVDVETDSTVAGTLDADMTGMSEVLKAVTQVITELAPMVQQGVLPFESAKELALSVIRRARLGMAVEDAFEKMKQPPPPPAQDQQKPDPAHAAQIGAQADVEVAKIRADAENKQATLEQQTKAAIAEMEDRRKREREESLEQMKTMREHFSAQLDAAVRVITATIAATKGVDATALSVSEPVFAAALGKPQPPGAEHAVLHIPAPAPAAPPNSQMPPAGGPQP